MTTNVKYEMGNINIPGIEGHFSQTKKVGGFMKIHHCILNNDGIGCKERVFIGEVPTESWENRIPNPSFKHDVEQIISEYLNKNNYAE